MFCTFLRILSFGIGCKNKNACFTFYIRSIRKKYPSICKPLECRDEQVLSEFCTWLQFEPRTKESQNNLKSTSESLCSLKFDHVSSNLI